MAISPPRRFVGSMLSAIASIVVCGMGHAGDSPPDVKPGSPTLLGITGMSVNGQIHSHGLPTTWQVEYGPTASYTRKTDVREIPPKLAAYYHES